MTSSLTNFGKLVNRVNVLSSSASKPVKTYSVQLDFENGVKDDLDANNNIASSFYVFKTSSPLIANVNIDLSTIIVSPYSPVRILNDCMSDENHEFSMVITLPTYNYSTNISVRCGETLSFYYNSCTPPQLHVLTGILPPINADASALNDLQIPTLSNLIISSGQGSQSQDLEWDETGTVVSRNIAFLSGSGTVNNLNSGGVNISNLVQNVGTTVQITLTNTYGSVSALIHLSNPCFLGEVELMTDFGPVLAKNIKEGDRLLQPDCSYSEVMKVKVSEVTHAGGNFDNDRLFADSEEKCIVTYWHKVRFLNDEDEEIKAGEHPKFHEVFREYPFKVYNFALEDFTHKIMIADTDIIAESFVPVNPA